MIFAAQKDTVIWRCKTKSTSLEKGYWGSSRPLNCFYAFCRPIQYCIIIIKKLENPRIGWCSLRNYCFDERLLKKFISNRVKTLRYFSCTLTWTKQVHGLRVLSTYMQNYVKYQHICRKNYVIFLLYRIQMYEDEKC